MQTLIIGKRKNLILLDRAADREPKLLLAIARPIGTVEASADISRSSPQVENVPFSVGPYPLINLQLG